MQVPSQRVRKVRTQTSDKDIVTGVFTGLMKITFVSQYFPPEPAAVKLGNLVRELTRRGHEVQVLTALPNAPRGRLFDGYRSTFLLREQYEGAEVLRTYIWPYLGRNVWKRIIYHMSFAVSATANCLRLRRCDALYLYQPPLTAALPALILAMFRRVPYICDVQDLWPEAGVAAEVMSERDLLYRAMQRVAAFIYRHAHRLSVISPAHRETIARDYGVAAEKIAIVENAADERHFWPVSSNGARERYDLPPGAFVVMYAGNFGSTHGIPTLIQVAELLRAQRDIVLVFVGGGAEYSKAVAAAREKRLENVRFLGYIQDKGDLKYLYAAADLMLVHLTKSRSGAVSLPSRIAAYMCCARPVLVASEGAPSILVRDAKAGVCCPPGDAGAIAEEIIKLKLDPARLLAYGANGRQYYLENMTQGICTERGVRLIENSLCSTVTA